MRLGVTVNTFNNVCSHFCACNLGGFGDQTAHLLISGLVTFYTPYRSRHEVPPQCSSGTRRVGTAVLLGQSKLDRSGSSLMGSTKCLLCHWPRGLGLYLGTSPIHNLTSLVARDFVAQLCTQPTNQWEILGHLIACPAVHLSPMGGCGVRN